MRLAILNTTNVANGAKLRSVVAPKDTAEWVCWMQLNDKELMVAETDISALSGKKAGTEVIRTHFTGMDLNHIESKPEPPCYFVTYLIRDGSKELNRYETWEMAEAGHVCEVAKRWGGIENKVEGTLTKEALDQSFKMIEKADYMYGLKVEANPCKEVPLGVQEFYNPTYLYKWEIDGEQYVGSDGTWQLFSGKSESEHRLGVRFLWSTFGQVKVGGFFFYKNVKYIKTSEKIAQELGDLFEPSTELYFGCDETVQEIV